MVFFILLPVFSPGLFAQKSLKERGLIGQVKSVYKVCRDWDTVVIWKPEENYEEQQLVWSVNNSGKMYFDQKGSLSLKIDSFHDREGKQVVSKVKYAQHGDKILEKRWYDNELFDSIVFRYNKQNKKIAKKYFDKEYNRVKKFTWTYGPKGNPVKEIVITPEDTATNTFDYKSHKNGVIREIVKTENDSDLLIKRYDNEGNKVFESRHGDLMFWDSNGNTYEKGPEIIWKKEFKYDESGNLVLEKYFMSGQFYYSWYLGQNYARENKKDSLLLRWKKTYAYYQSGYKKKETKCDDDGKVIYRWNWEYAFDEKGNWTRKTISGNVRKNRECIRKIEYYE